jgi:hypothetical protein
LRLFLVSNVRMVTNGRAHRSDPADCLCQ